MDSTSTRPPFDLDPGSEDATGDARPPSPALVYLDSLGEEARSAQVYALRAILRLLDAPSGETIESYPWHKLRYEHAQKLRRRLIETYKPATVNRTLCAYRRTLRAAWRCELMTRDAYEHAADVRSVRDSPIVRGREVPIREIRALLRAAERDENRLRGTRDGALVALLYGAGLRRREVQRLDVEHLVRERGGVHVAVMAKGRERRVPLPAGVVQAIERYLAEGRGGRHPGPLFPGQGCPRMDVGTLHRRLLALAKRAKVRRLRSHDLRGQCVTDLLRAGVDTLLVSEIVGHGSPTITKRYDKRGDCDKVRALGRLSFLRRK